MDLIPFLEEEMTDLSKFISAEFHVFYGLFSIFQLWLSKLLLYIARIPYNVCGSLNDFYLQSQLR